VQVGRKEVTCKPGLPLWLPGHRQLYIRPPPSEPFLSLFPPERLERPWQGPALPPASTEETGNG
jgi:hypothetical protein